MYSILERGCRDKVEQLTVAIDIKDYQCLAEKLVQCVEKTERAQLHRQNQSPPMQRRRYKKREELRREITSGM